MWVLSCIHKCYPEQVDIKGIHGQPGQDCGLIYDMVKLVTISMRRMRIRVGRNPQLEGN